MALVSGLVWASLPSVSSSVVSASPPELGARAMRVPILPRLTLSSHVKVTKQRSCKRGSDGRCLPWGKLERTDATERFGSPHGVVSVNSREFGNLHFPVHLKKGDTDSLDEVIFEEGIFEDAFHTEEVGVFNEGLEQAKNETGSGSLIPDDWRSFQVELNKTKTEKRKELLSQQLENAKKKQTKHRLRREKVETREMHGDFIGSASCLGGAPVAATSVVGNKVDEAQKLRDQDGTEHMMMGNDSNLDETRISSASLSQRAIPRNPRLQLGEITFEDISRKLQESTFTEQQGQTSQESEENRTDHQTLLTVEEKEYLRRKGPDLGKLCSDGATLLHYTVQTAATNLVKLLIRHGVDVNSCDEQGWTPLHLAVQTGRADMVKLLLMNGANQSLKNKDGLTPLDLCLAFGRGFNSYEVSKVLKKFLKASTEANKLLLNPLDVRLQNE